MSANRYWRRSGHHLHISNEARSYINLVSNYSLIFGWNKKSFNNRIELIVDAYPPDKRERDLDNILKVLIDSLQRAGLFNNDSQIDKITIERKHIVKKGSVSLTLKEYINDRLPASA